MRRASGRKAKNVAGAKYLPKLKRFTEQTCYIVCMVIILIILQFHSKFDHVKIYIFDKQFHSRSNDK